jgi:hypothetical protein
MKTEKSVWDMMKKDVTGNIAAKMPTMLTCKPECIPGMMVKNGFTMTAGNVWVRGKGPFFTDVEVEARQAEEMLSKGASSKCGSEMKERAKKNAAVKAEYEKTLAPAKTNWAAVAAKQQAEQTDVAWLLAWCAEGHGEIVTNDRQRRYEVWHKTASSDLMLYDAATMGELAGKVRADVAKAATVAVEDQAAFCAKMAKDRIAEIDAHGQGIAKVETPAAQDGEIRFFWNGIKVGKGKLQKCGWSFCENYGYRGDKGAVITGYAKHYVSFSTEIRAAFTVENGTDAMTDYFENDHIVVPVGHPLFGKIAQAMLKHDCHDADKLRALLAPTSPESRAMATATTPEQKSSVAEHMADKQAAADDMARIVDSIDGGPHHAAAKAVERAAARAGVVATCTPREVAVLADYRKAKAADTAKVAGHWHPTTGLWVRPRHAKLA